MLVSIKYKYNFTNTKVKTEVEHAIQKNLYMFDILNTNAFYYPNNNMFSMSNAEKNIKGQILTLKKTIYFLKVVCIEHLSITE